MIQKWKKSDDIKHMLITCPKILQLNKTNKQTNKQKIIVRACSRPEDYCLILAFYQRVFQAETQQHELQISKLLVYRVLLLFLCYCAVADIVILL